MLSPPPPSHSLVALHSLLRTSWSGARHRRSSLFVYGEPKAFVPSDFGGASRSKPKTCVFWVFVCFFLF